MKPESPCKDCKKRDIHCHSVCEEYIAYQDESREYNEKVLIAKRERYGHHDYIVESIKRMKRGKK